MTHVMNFNSMEEAIEWMAKATDEANANLHPAQRDVTFGSYWIRFVDIAARIVEFGYVIPLDDIGFEPEDGYPAEVQREEMIANTERGYLFSDTHSILGDEKGDTHRANVWPIEERLFNMAKDVDWKIDDLDDTGKVLVEIAFAAYRSHLRSL